MRNSDKTPGEYRRLAAESRARGDHAVADELERMALEQVAERKK